MPTLAGNAPRIGQTFVVLLTQGTPNATGFLVYSAVPAASISLGFGCSVEVDLGTASPLAPVTTNQAGTWLGSFPLPPDPNLVGLQVALQIALLGTPGPFGLDISNGLIATAGY
jgi:hypothetical protein